MFFSGIDQKTIDVFILIWKYFRWMFYILKYWLLYFIFNTYSMNLLFIFHNYYLNSNIIDFVFLIIRIIRKKRRRKKYFKNNNSNNDSNNNNNNNSNNNNKK